MKIVYSLGLLCSFGCCFLGNIKAVTPADVLETSLCEADESVEIPWFKKHPIILGMGVYETNILKNYAKYIPVEFEKGQEPATIKLIDQLFEWRNGEFKVPRSFGKIGHRLTVAQVGHIAGIISSDRSSQEKSSALEGFFCAPGCQNTFHFNKNKMKKCFLNVLASAEKECQITAKGSSLFPAHMPLLILYAFAYKKANNRTELIDFFNSFLAADTSLKGCEPFSDKGASLLQEPSVLEPDNKAKGSRLWSDITADKSKLKNMSTEDFEYDEECAAVAIEQGWNTTDIVPRMTLKTEIPEVGLEYNDCVEDVLYKLVLLLRKYRPKKTCDTLSSSLIRCLKEKDWMLTKEGHAYWNHEIVGGKVPYMIYHSVVCNGSVLTKEGECVICLPSTSSLLPENAPADGLFFLEDSQMLAFREDGDCIGYEISSHMSNMIIGLNRILGLNLDIQASDWESFWGGSFCKKYFKELGKKLDTKFSLNIDKGGDNMQVKVAFEGNKFLLFSKNFLHIGLLSLANIRPFRVFEDDCESDEINVFTSFLETNALPKGQFRCAYPLSLFTGSWDDFDSKNKVRERFFNAQMRCRLPNYTYITDCLGAEMIPA